MSDDGQNLNSLWDPEDERQLFWAPPSAEPVARDNSMFNKKTVEPPVSAYANKPVLKRGSSGADVAELQNLLNSVSPIVMSQGGLKTDGQFGVGTEGAVKSFQEQVKLPPSGVVAEATWSALAQVLTQKKPTAKVSVALEQAAGWVNKLLSPEEAPPLPAPAALDAGTSLAQQGASLTPAPEPPNWTPYVVGGVVLLGLGGLAYYYSTQD
jgi:peptidoglycan hydrolase-like protein with peptidoglycan-binding domain